jgi:hypothetical protein
VINFTDKFFYHYIDWYIPRNCDGKIINKKLEKYDDVLLFLTALSTKLTRW